MKRYVVILFASIMLAACFGEEGAGEFNFEKASLRWNTVDKTWNEHELKALQAGHLTYRRYCAACHGKYGDGDSTIGAPSLHSNAIVGGDIKYHIALIKSGKNLMPPYTKVLTDEEILRVAAFERNVWGNHDYGVFLGTGDE